jgi:hypothetical protein
MIAKKIAEACGLKFHIDLHKKYASWNTEFRQDLPSYWFIEHSSIDGKIRLFSPSQQSRFQFMVELNKDVGKSVKLVNIIREMERAKCYDPVDHVAEVLSGSLGDFAFASVGQPTKLLNGFYEVNATIDPNKMADPHYNNFWRFDRARYHDDKKYGVVKYNDRSYVPYIGIDKVFLVHLKKFYELRDAYFGELLGYGMNFHTVTGMANFRKYD